MTDIFENYFKWDSSNGFVPTPKNLTDEIVETFLTHAKKNPEFVIKIKNGSAKILFPFLKSGTFVVSFVDACKKVFGIDITESIVIFAARRHFRVKFISQYPQFSKFIYDCDFLTKKNCPSIYKDMKFDLIVGNPPYQNSTDTNSGSSDKLWMEFVKTSISSLEKNGYMCIVHPTGWRTLGNEMWKDVYQKIQVEYVKIEPKVEWSIKSVNVKVDWYILKNSSYSNPTIVEFADKTKNIDFREVTGINGDAVVERLLNCIDDKIKFVQTSQFHTQYKKYSKTKTDLLNFEARHTTPKKVLYFGEQHKWQNEKKVLVSNSGYLYPTYDDGKLGTTQACWAVFVKSKIEGEYLVRLLNSKLFTYFINSVKTSGYNNKLLKLLPYPKGLSDNFTDSDLYARFNLTDDEIKLVETSIKS